MPIRYHLPSDGFILSVADLRGTAENIVVCMRSIRKSAGLPLTPCFQDPCDKDQHHVRSALQALHVHATDLGIDLGADRWYKLDVREKRANSGHDHY